MEAQLYRVAILDFFIFVIVDIHRRFFIKANEFVKGIGYRNVTDITRRKIPGTRKRFSEFRINDSMHKIAPNCIFIDLETISHIINKSKLGTYGKNQIITILHQELSFIMNMINAKDGNENDFINNQLFIEAVPITCDTVKQRSLPINIDFSNQNLKPIQKITIPTNQSTEQSYVINEQNHLNVNSRKSNFIKFLKTSIQFQKKNTEILELLLKKLV